MKNKLNVLTLDKESFYLLLLDFKTIVQHFAICRTEILFEQQKMMLGAVNLGKSYQNTGQLLRQKKRISLLLVSLYK